jgi:hypothetical protein
VVFVSMRHHLNDLVFSTPRFVAVKGKTLSLVVVSLYGYAPPQNLSSDGLQGYKLGYDKIPSRSSHLVDPAVFRIRFRSSRRELYQRGPHSQLLFRRLICAYWEISLANDKTAAVRRLDFAGVCSLPDPNRTPPPNSDVVGPGGKLLPASKMDL